MIFEVMFYVYIVVWCVLWVLLIAWLAAGNRELTNHFSWFEKLGRFAGRAVGWVVSFLRSVLSGRWSWKQAASDWALAHMVNNEPTQVIGPRGEDEPPYLTRWCVIPKNKWFCIYIHEFGDDDEDRALHDHPWPSLSLLIQGRLKEHMHKRVVVREVGAVVFRRPKHKHRLQMDCEGTAITIFVVGPRVRQWGFHCPGGWVDWRAFVDPDDPGKTGAGCGEYE